MSICIHLREGADLCGCMVEFCEFDNDCSPDCDKCDHYEED
jgi:hypothetical protein